MHSIVPSGDSRKARFGLALSGGGSKGAYHVGVLRYLAETGLEVDAVGGASIGALNGAVVAASANMTEAASRLEQVWRHLADNNPIKHADDLTWQLSLVLSMAGNAVLPLPMKAALYQFMDRGGLYSDAPVNEILTRFLDMNALRAGKPFHVSVYRSHGMAWLDSLVGVLGPLVGLIDTPDSEFIHVQSLAEGEQVQAILASAAIPLFFRAKKVNGQEYVDGGTGGSRRVQGNTPVTPLVSAEGCDWVIVCHLSDGSLWSRNDFPQAEEIIEIRPGSPLKRGSTLGDMVGFDKANILDWMKQGYDDAKRCIGEVAARLELRHRSIEAREALRKKVAALDEDGFCVE